MSYFYIIFTIFLFSTLEVTGKIIGAEISPFAITIYRFLIGGLFILPFAIKQFRGSTLSFKDYVHLSIPGIINVSIAMLFLQLAIFHGQASISAILISVNPIFVAIFSFFILKERLSLMKILGLIIGLIGVVLIVGDEINLNSFASGDSLGVIFGIISSVAFGLYTVVSKKYIAKYGNLRTNSFSFLIGSAVLAIISLLFGFDISFKFSNNNIIFILYLGIFVTGIAYISFFEGLKKIKTATGSMFFFLKPIIASTLAFFLFGEKLNSLQMIGVFIVILGINIELMHKNIFKKLLN